MGSLILWTRALDLIKKRKQAEEAFISLWYPTANTVWLVISYSHHHARSSMVECTPLKLWTQIINVYMFSSQEWEKQLIYHSTPALAQTNSLLQAFCSSTTCQIDPRQHWLEENKMHSLPYTWARKAIGKNTQTSIYKLGWRVPLQARKQGTWAFPERREPVTLSHRVWEEIREQRTLTFVLKEEQDFFSRKGLECLNGCQREALHEQRMF